MSASARRKRRTFSVTIEARSALQFGLVNRVARAGRRRLFPEIFQTQSGHDGTLQGLVTTQAVKEAVPFNDFDVFISSTTTSQPTHLESEVGHEDRE